MIYAGIGSRKTPEFVLGFMESLANGLWLEEGAILRSGRAPGADQAFESGADMNAGTAEIYLPWPKFELQAQNVKPTLTEPTEEAFVIASKYHPSWPYLTYSVQKLMARNSHQILGEDLNTPADFVLCWTPGKHLTGSERGAGGTGQALRIAYDLGIEVFNLSIPAHQQQWDKWLMKGGPCPAKTSE